MRTTLPNRLTALNFLAGQCGDRQKSMSASADNATASVTILAPGAGKCILINGVTAGFEAGSVSATKTLTLIEDVPGPATTVAVVTNKTADQLRGYLHNENKSARVSLAASGILGVKGFVSVSYSIVDTAQEALSAS